MCRAVTCRKCGLATWAGCGQHASQVLVGVPAPQRCTGHTGDPAASDPAASSGGRLRRLFGKNSRSLWAE
jgi:hypothetical protein